MFETLDLSHKRTRDRVELCLGLINGQTTFTRADLDLVCGQRNKPLGKVLRMLFLQVPMIVGKKSGEIQFYVLDKEAVKDLRKRYVTHTTNTGLVAE